MKKVPFAELHIKVIPKASKNAIVGWEEDFLKIRVNAPPEKGKANEELIAFLAKILGIPKSLITVEQGETSRYKKLRFMGVDQTMLLEKIRLILEKS